jgi:hypothetical protein
METYPLHWPLGRKKTEKYQRTHSSFKTTLARARDGVTKQLGMMNAKDIVISSNVNTYMRGGQEIMYADQSQAKEEPGVAVYFTWKKKQYALSCDKYNTVMDNLQAIMKTLEAIRGIERWGTGDMMEAAFDGFKSLPEPQAQQKSWCEILEVKPWATAEQIKEAYRKKAMEVHPDKGGTSEMFTIVKNAYDQGLLAVNS